MRDTDRDAIIAACERLVVDYTHLVDFGRAAEVAALFTEDGVWSSPEVTMEGREAIAKGFSRRQAMDRTSRHVCTNLAIDVVDEDHATGIVYLTLYRADGAGDGPAPLDGPALIGHYEDTFVRSDEGWRFRTRKTALAFLRR